MNGQKNEANPPGGHYGMLYQKIELLKKVTASLFILLAVFCIFCNNKEKGEFPPEPADPDTEDHRLRYSELKQI